MIMIGFISFKELFFQENLKIELFGRWGSVKYKMI